MLRGSWGSSQPWLCWRDELGEQPGGKKEQTQVEAAAIGNCLSKKTGMLECSLSGCNCSDICPGDTRAGVQPEPSVGVPAMLLGLPCVPKLLSLCSPCPSAPWGVPLGFLCPCCPWQGHSSVPVSLWGSKSWIVLVLPFCCCSALSTDPTLN